MKRCPKCAEEIQDAAVRCRFCGEALSPPETSLLAQITGAEIKLQKLIADLPSYGRKFALIFRSPFNYFRHLDYAAADSPKQGVAFMLQGIALSFVLFTMHWALPQQLVRTYFTAPAFLMFDPPGTLIDTATRIQAARAALPSSLTKDGIKRAELAVVIRALPEESFQYVLTRFRALAESGPDLLEHVVKGTLALGESGSTQPSRGYVLWLFMAIDPNLGPLIQQSRDLASVGTTYELKPHVDFLLRNLLLWAVVCYVVSRALPSQPAGGRRVVFIVGSYLVGFLGPLFYLAMTLLNVYLAASLPTYVHLVNGIFSGTGGPGNLDQLSGGIFPYENLLLLVINVMIPLAIVAVAIGALVIGIRCATSVSRSQAVGAAGFGIAVGLGTIEIVAGLLVLLLAPTGLL